VLSEGEIKVSDKVTLRCVSLVQSLGFNFLSLSQLLDKGFEVLFRLSGSRIFNSQGDLVCIVVPEGQVFRVDFSQSSGVERCFLSGSSSELWKWHRKLGHLSFDLLSLLSKLNLVQGLPRLKFDKVLVCAPCRHAKMVASSHPPHRCDYGASMRVAPYGPCWANSCVIYAWEVVHPSCGGQLLSVCVGFHFGTERGDV
jgi:hypothetical protein